eukprot:6402857-Amphidinium_carterae.1
MKRSVTNSHLGPNLLEEVSGTSKDAAVTPTIKTRSKLDPKASISSSCENAIAIKAKTHTEVRFTIPANMS